MQYLRRTHLRDVCVFPPVATARAVVQGRALLWSTNLVLRAAVSHALRRAGFEVISVGRPSVMLHDVLAARGEHSERNVPQLAVFDVPFPPRESLRQLDGLHSALPDLPIIALVDRRDRDSMLDAYLLVGGLVLTKPLDLELLQAAAMNSRHKEGGLPAESHFSRAPHIAKEVT
jgi:DNA-binding response OmpR family regulator